MMPYAANGVVSQAVIDGGIEITDAQYLEAINGMMAGWVVTIDGGFHVGPIVPSEPEPEPPTEAEILAAQSLKLQGFTQLAAAQKTALTNRIGTINDAIEFEEATAEEIAELPIRQAQLTEWKRYAIYLGRVTTQAGWYATVEWPVQPAAGMDLTVSAVSRTTDQTS